MNEERLNPHFNINAKYEAMIRDSKEIVKHYLSKESNGEPTEGVCLAYDVKNYLPSLLQENKELKTKLELYENGVIYSSENEGLSKEVDSWTNKYNEQFDKNKELHNKIEYLKNKIENKDRWCQLIADIGYDYDGYRTPENLMSLIDELVQYSLYSRDNYDYEEILKDSDVDE